MDMFMKALMFAAVFHDGQVDKAGVAYIMHPIWVASQMPDETAKVVALLHDTVEDTAATLETIEALFGATIKDSVAVLTRQRNETYEDYIRNVSMDPVATRVKLADLEHNMMPRFSPMTGEDEARMARYKRAHDFLLGVKDGFGN